MNQPSRWPVSAWLLLGVNLIPIAGVIFLDWEVLSILVLFWLENIIVGVVNLLRMGVASASPGQKLPMMAFFTVHYGGFAFGHGFAVTHFFGDPSRLELEPQALLSFVQQQGLGFAALAMLISHLISFMLNDANNPMMKAKRLGDIMRAAYQRVAVLHITILVGGFLVSMLGSPLWALLVLVVLKTAMDLKGHLKRLQQDSKNRQHTI
ncbi:MAG: DUF6498-containing protein [Lysobacterales bacterium]